MKVKDIMTEDVQIVKEDDTVETCAKLLLKNNFTGLPVINDRDQMVGIVTESDLIKRMAHLKAPGVLELLGGLIYLDNPNTFMDDIKKAMAYEVEELMSKELVTVKPDDTIEHAATLMLENDIKRLPVRDVFDRVLGIVSRRDVLRYMYNDTAEK
ncbi:CBS domain-containing protein [Texcoconibacillus texcoconensis]|uniref:CBS domain-containing protein n=1 Tax=Texcoconibacillus texcoconensis TaxID=1095777 RepID=A0A840QKK3_9BACI|nr:CBS domain-containing protein [Texcoconibacillus texcoconensis]MBB5171887.1 CBS domain-containing protein [Texcoconibacillus texcoconensis]